MNNDIKRYLKEVKIIIPLNSKEKQDFFTYVIKKKMKNFNNYICIITRINTYKYICIRKYSKK